MSRRIKCTRLRTARSLHDWAFGRRQLDHRGGFPVSTPFVWTTSHCVRLKIFFYVSSDPVWRNFRPSIAVTDKRRWNRNTFSRILELSRHPGKRHNLIEILRISPFLGSKGTLQHFANAPANTYHIYTRMKEQKHLCQGKLSAIDSKEACCEINSYELIAYQASRPSILSNLFCYTWFLCSASCTSLLYSAIQLSSAKGSII